MKAIELVKKLNELIAEHGDKKITLYFDDEDYEILEIDDWVNEFTIWPVE